jgi:hypothetical protein
MKKHRIGSTPTNYVQSSGLVGCRIKVEFSNDSNASKNFDLKQK